MKFQAIMEEYRNNFFFFILTRTRVITEKFSSNYVLKFQERIFDFPVFAQLYEKFSLRQIWKIWKIRSTHIPFVTVLPFDYPASNRGFVLSTVMQRVLSGKIYDSCRRMKHFNSCRDVIRVRFSRVARHCPPFHVDLEIKRFIGMDNHRIVL